MDYYTIHIDHPHRLLSVCVRGFWTDDIAASYLRDLAPVISTIDRSRLVYDVLCDATEWQVQSPTVQTTIQDYFERQWLGRRAFVLPGALLRLQAARVIPRVVENERTKVFTSRVQALAWLASDPLTLRPNNNAAL